MTVSRMLLAAFFALAAGIVVENAKATDQPVVNSAVAERK